MDPAKMKVVDLRSELGALGLDTKGNKPALVERLKKALETKTGKTFADTTILDTSSEEVEEPATPRRSAAARTTRRSSSSRQAPTPAKLPREETPQIIEKEPIEEEPKEEELKEEEPKEEEPKKDVPEVPLEEDVPPPEPEPVREPEPLPVPEPIKEPEVPEEIEPEVKSNAELTKDDIYCIDEPSDSPDDKQDTEEEEKEPNPQDGSNDKQTDQQNDKNDDEKMDQSEEDHDVKDKSDSGERERSRRWEMTEEEEWEQLNERLIQKEQERLEREKQQAEEDAKRLEEISKDPIKLQRLKRKQEKKARWSNFYKTIEVTNEVLAPVDEPSKDKKELAELKAEPDLDDDKVTLSWYDSDLNQYLEQPHLNSVVPLGDGAFAHAWAGTRASHGAVAGRVVYEVRVGAVVTTTESTEKESIVSGLRVGWSTDDSSLHLGDGELSWGYESTGRIVHNCEFKEYGNQFNEKDVVGVYLDLESTPCKISYTLNGIELGTAFEFDKETLQGKALFPHILTKNVCYKVNFGYDRYNMLTKTKIVRKRIEIPVEQVLEEKRKREEEIKKQKEEAARKERERREKEKKDREDRQRKKREERERQEKERKEKAAQEKRDRDNSMEVEEDKEEKDKVEKDKQEKDKLEKDKVEKDKLEKEKDKEEELENDVQEVPKDEETTEEPKENGENPDTKSQEVKEQPMETEEKSSVDKESSEVEKEPLEDVKEITEEQVLTGHVLDKRIKFVIRHCVEEELDGAEACLLPGYVLLALAGPAPGPRRPARLADCEVILMVGLPGSGKTYWAKKHCAEHPERRYNILSTGALFERMKVDCKPFRSSYEGKWDAMVSKCAKCVIKMLEIAKGRRRNFILDQTNVYPSAQRRKLREFEGYRRVAVVLVVDEKTQRTRAATREAADGKEVPDPAALDMKANFSLPERGAWLDDVLYAELGEAEAREAVDAYHREAAAAGAVRDKDKRSRSASRDAPPAKRARSPDRERRERRRDHARDREDRWGSGGSRWGPASGQGGGHGGSGGRGGRRGGRDRGGGMGQGPTRFDRGWAPPPPRNEFGRDRDSFRGGRGGPGGPRQDRGPGGLGPVGSGGPTGPGGPGLGPPGARGPPGGERFQRDNRNQNRGPPHQNDKRQGPSQGGGNQGGSGSWQRGSQQQPRGPRPTQQVSRQDNQNQPQNQNQNQNQQPGWNQWTGGWGGWAGNWNNQNQAGWGNWNNWNNWGNQQQGAQGAGGKQPQQQQQQQQGQQGQQGQWGGYSAQQWYQWQQWQQQQQQGWQGFQQQQGNAQSNTNAADAAQAWAQFYQNYGGANTGNTNATNTAVEKK